VGIGCEPEQLPNIILDKERRLRLRLLPSLKLRQAGRLRLRKGSGYKGQGARYRAQGTGLRPLKESNYE